MSRCIWRSFRSRDERRGNVDGKMPTPCDEMIDTAWKLQQYDTPSIRAKNLNGLLPTIPLPRSRTMHLKITKATRIEEDSWGAGFERKSKKEGTQQVRLSKRCEADPVRARLLIGVATSLETPRSNRTM